MKVLLSNGLCYKPLCNHHLIDNIRRVKEVDVTQTKSRIARHLVIDTLNKY